MGVQRTMKLGFVVPGEKVGVIEEFIPGDGLIVQDGDVYAVKAGLVKFDMKARIARIEPLGGDHIPRQGDFVLARVVNVEKNFVSVEVFAIERAGKSVHVDLAGVIVTRAKLRREDILRAQVVLTTNPLLLDIDKPGMGIVYAVCPKCLSDFVLRRGSLICPSCGYKERRKIASNNMFRKA